DEGIVVQKETETRYKIVKVSRHHVEIAESLKDNKLKVPVEGREKLLRAIQPLTARLSIQSDLEEHFENLPLVEADNRIHALFTPAGEGFHLEFFVKPFGKVPPYFKPGKGSESVIADVDGVRTRTKRDLRRERELLDEIEEACPFLAEFESPNYEWSLADAEQCLTALNELEKPREAGKLVVEWTKGQKLKLLGSINFDNLSLSVKGGGNWFEVEGKARVNEDLVLSMKELNQFINQNKGNFVELSDGQFIAITEKLRKHLQSLGAVLDDKNRLHHLRSGILEDISDELENFKADKAWREHLEKIKTAAKFVPELPATFEAEDGEAKDKRFRILAELTRLRLACCHPKLVNENAPLTSSKLELFGETLEELLENKHKALVFSQFVKHLRIVEDYLKKKGVLYHYLDGSTPPAVRQQRIDAFLRGDGEVFLISLKAGGTGLNLTAANYVVHLDPWWNQAVEDQASDRAHRIGQQRPVTVYRLVTENTVEEKILRLHETKRDLADSLLEGTDSSGKLSAEDLLALIEEV
ncbi:MAG TPA: helicase-related protein, partial [Pyrinomonadaceae bacterium]|nr:helicase-related protein [Pyrinomonadaceae bacterium]